MSWFDKYSKDGTLSVSFPTGALDMACGECGVVVRLPMIVEPREGGIRWAGYKLTVDYAHAIEHQKVAHRLLISRVRHEVA